MFEKADKKVKTGHGKQQAHADHPYTFLRDQFGQEIKFPDDKKRKQYDKYNKSFHGVSGNNCGSCSFLVWIAGSEWL